jgi:hypothetical protein
MNNSSYSTLYDIGVEVPASWFPMFGLLFVALGVAGWRNGRSVDWLWHWPLRSPRARTIWTLVWIGFSATWTLVAGVGVVGSFVRNQYELRMGQAQIVEGTVEDFHPMPFGGHDTERFRVGGVHFAYSDFVVSPGFNHTSSHGGPIRQGLAVRIHYRGPEDRATILMLEARQ